MGKSEEGMMWMKQTWDLRTYEKGDENGIVRLFNLAFAESETEYALEKWKWKYHNTPRHLIAIAEYDSQIIGHMGLIPVKMKVGRRTLTCCQGVDLAVHPNFRRQGMFLELANLLVRNSEEEGIPLWYGVAIIPAYYGHLKYGQFFVDDIRSRIRLLNTNNVLSQYWPELQRLSPLVKVFTKSIDISLLALSRITTAEPDDLEIARCHTFDDSVNQLWHEVSNRYGIMIVREKGYLNWRYCERSDRKYETFVARSGDDVVGYVVCATKEVRGGKWGYIADILTNSDEVFEIMIEYSLENLARKDVDMITLWNPPALARPSTLRKKGFLPSPRSAKLIVRLSSSQLSKEFISQPGNWYFTIGDFDLI